MQIMKWLTIAVPVIVLAFFTMGSAKAFTISIHEEITVQALNFLREETLNDIADEHIYVDVIHALERQWHFDSCEFRGATQNINELYARTINALNPDQPDLGDASDAFGQLLHPIQDFYAHSNWVEIGKAELINNDLSWWPVLRPFDNVQGVLVIQGEENTIPVGYTLTRSGSVAMVGTPNGSFPGLLTGTFGVDDCPNNIALEHGDLNKDEPGTKSSQPWHPYARALASKQTMYEWCRLLNLVRQTYGERGEQFLLDKWVADRQRAEEICVDLDAVFIVYVDQSVTSEFELGTAIQPFRSLTGAMRVAPNRSTLAIALGHYPEYGVYDKTVELHSIGGLVIIGQ